MFKLLERGKSIAGSRFRTVTLTPEVVAAAQVKVERFARLTAEARLSEAALPPPTVTPS